MTASIRAPWRGARPWIALVAGCAGARAGTPDGALSEPRAVVVVPAAPTDRVAARGHVSPEACSRKLVVDALEKAEGCVVEESVTAGPGLLAYACGGGPAEARFQDEVFRGQVSNGELELRLEREFRYEDGCRWQSVERIAGSLAGGRLRYSYDGAPLPDQLGCAEPCGASARVTVIDPE